MLYFCSKYDFYLMDMSDFVEFWKSEWIQIVKKIRQDFETLYGAIHQETISFYEKKTKEIQAELALVAEHEEIGRLEQGKALARAQTEYAEVQEMYSYEQISLQKSEALLG